MSNYKLIRATTVPVSLKILLKGQHRYMNDKGFEVVGAASTGNELEEVAENEGIRAEALEMTRTVSPFKDLKSLWQFYNLCKKEKPHIVHSHTPKAGIIGMMGAKLAGVPIRLHTVAGLPLMEATGAKRKLLDFVERLTYSCSSKVYPNSKGLYDFIVSNRYTTTDKLKVIANGSSNGIDSEYFSVNRLEISYLQSLKQELRISESDFVYVFIGRLVRDKGIEELVLAFTQINHAHPQAKLLLVGSQEQDLDPLNPETLREIEVNPAIISVGYQNDVRPYFAISNVLTFPSYREGFPNVVMQAGAMELPSIVSDINGCNEIIIEGQNGTIIPPKNVEALTDAMQRIMEDKEYYNRLKENARPMITSRYEQQVVWNALLAEYERLLEEKGLKK